VIYVDWYQANAFCEWRNTRLPTEAEWEKAARGTNLSDTRSLPWNYGIDCEQANYTDYSNGDQKSCVGDTTIEGQYGIGKSPYGAYDMAGNVAEWVADWYSETYYTNGIYDNPLGATTGIMRGVRGGSWWEGQLLLLSYMRDARDPHYSDNYLGFRCAYSPIP